MFKKFIYQGLPMSLLIVLSAAMQGFAVRAFADEAAPAVIIEQVR